MSAAWRPGRALRRASRHPRLRAALLSLLAACGASGAEAPQDAGPGAPAFVLRPVAEGLDWPVDLTAPAGDPRLFVVEQAGRIRIIENGHLAARPFLDLTDRVRSGGERGLLGLAFHPSYSANGRFFVNYTDRDGNTRVEGYRVSGDRAAADPASAEPVLMVPQPYANHNGGQLAFGPDGYLYIALGDGGSGGDPQGNGQNPGTLLGAILRLDVDGGPPYAIPPGNPFLGRSGGRPEVWAWGLRNPWRFSFDRETGDLYIADVGQNEWEEVNVAVGNVAGENYGWNVREGRHCYGAATCSTSGMTDPALEYDHSEGCSVTGGFVYRGAGIPALRGAYLFSDYCRGWIRSFRLVRGAVTEIREWTSGGVGRVLSFGQDAAGELYVLTDRGVVHRLAPAG